MPVMGTVQNGNRSLVCEPGVVRWVGGSRLFADRFASANVRVTSGCVGGGMKPVVGEASDSSTPSIRVWVSAFDPWSSDSVYVGEVE